MSPNDPALLVFGIRYKEASGSSGADGFKQELGGKLWLTVPQCPPPPSWSHWWLNGVNRRDRVLTPLSGPNLGPITFSVCSNCGSTVDSAGEKGKVKAESKGSASIHLTGWVNGNKWLSFDRLYIHLFSVTTVKDTGAYLCCTPDKMKTEWCFRKREKENTIAPFCLLGPLSMKSYPSVASVIAHSTPPPVVDYHSRR